MLVTTPRIPSSSGAFSIVDGDQFVCRAFAGRSAFAFQTEVLKTAHLPFPQLHLRYPESVEAVVIRRASRVPMQRSVSVINGAADAKPQAHYGLEFIDLTPEHTRCIQELIQQQLLSEV